MWILNSDDIYLFLNEEYMLLSSLFGWMMNVVRFRVIGWDWEYEGYFFI